MSAIWFQYTHYYKPIWFQYAHTVHTIENKSKDKIDKFPWVIVNFPGHPTPMHPPLQKPAVYHSSKVFAFEGFFSHIKIKEE